MHTRSMRPAARAALLPAVGARAALALATFALAGTLTACGGGESNAPAARALGVETGYWRLGVNHEALLMSTAAPYDTIQLVVTPQNALGDALPAAVRDSAVTTFTLADPADTNVTVSPAGLVRARHPDVTAITIRTTTQGITRTATIPLTVTTVVNPPKADHLSLQVTPADSYALMGDTLGFSRTIVAQVLDEGGQPIDGAPFAFHSPDTLRANVDPSGMLTFNYEVKTVGPLMIHVGTTAYGVRLSDSVRVTVLPPLLGFIVTLYHTPRGSTLPIGFFSVRVDTIALGATVAWSNEGGPTDNLPIDIVFDDPSAAEVSNHFLAHFCDPDGHGNVPAFAPDTTKPCNNMARARAFRRRGTFPYHSELYGSTGVIIVR